MTSIRRTVAATAVAASALVGAAAALAPAANAAPASYVTQESCTNVHGTIVYSPGLLKSKTRTTVATLVATISGCTDKWGGHDESGTGTLSASLSGTSSYGHVNESGTFAIGWPQFYNPTTGTATLSGPAADGTYTLSGSTAGAFAGGIFSVTILPTRTNAGATGLAGHPLKKQWFTNTLPLTVSHNLG